MAERQCSKMERKRDRQPISVPFIWEVKPGMPKKDWKPMPRPVEPVAPPVKLVVSVPFEWEQKPGIPIPGFIQSQEEPIISSSPSQYPGQDDNDEKEVLSHSNSEKCNFTKPVMRPVKFVVSIPFEWEEKPGTPIPGFTQHSTEPTFAPSCEHRLILSSPPRYLGQGDNERDESSDSEIDVWSSATDDSFSSAPSLLANRLISTTALSSAIPFQETCLDLITANSPGSPASETDSTSSYATGTTSLVGSSFLEWLFPLLVPNSNFATKVEKNAGQTDVQVKNFLHESSCSQVTRPLLTLGELIVMSRRMSCQRKVPKMQKQTSTDFLKRNTFGCGIFGSGEGMIGLNRKWKRQLQLKLI